MSNKKSQTEEDSVFKRLFVASPFAAGLGFAGVNSLKDRRFKLFNTQGVVPSAIKNFNSDISKNNRFSAQFMNENAVFFRTTEGSELAKVAWEKAISSTSPNPNELMSFAGNLDSLSSGGIASAIEQTLARNQSLFMNRTFMKFKANVRALQRHLEVTKNIPKFNEVKDLAFQSPISVSTASLPKELHESFSRIQKKLNADGQIFFQTRKGWEEQGFGQYLFKFNFKGKEINLNIPIAKGGLLVEGTTLSSKRIAPNVMLWDPLSKQVTGEMTRHEFLMRHFEESVLPRITSGELKSQLDIKSAVSELYAKDIYALENVPNIPSTISHQGWKNYSDIGAQAIDVLAVENGKFRSITERELGPVMQATGLFPSTSPSNIAQGRLSRFDPSKWAMNSAAIDYSRRPSQARREWKATHKAVGEMIASGNTKWSIFETQSWRQDMGAYAAPHLRTLYIDPSKHASLLESIKMGEGESLVSKIPALQKQMEVSRIAHPAHLQNIREGLADLIKSGHQFTPGEVLGFDTEGLPFTYDPSMKLKELVEHQTVGKGQFASLFYEQTHRMTESEKKFGSIKAMERFTQDAFKIDKQVKDLANNELFTGNITRWASMDELKKDQSKHTTQMITAMWDVLDQMRTRDFIQRNKKLASFMRNPTVFTSFLAKKANIGNTYSHQEFTKNLIKFGIQEGRLTPEEFGGIFGALPNVFGEASKELVPNERYYNAITSGFTRGISQAVFGGTKELTGAGALGSLEPRAFELLSGGQYGNLGQDITNELTQRLVADNPDKLSSYNALTKTLESIAGKSGPGFGDKIWNVSERGYQSKEFQRWIEAGGGYLKTGKGQSNVFVPGSTDLESITPFLTASGTQARGDLSSLYHQLAQEASYLHSKVEPSDVTDYRRSLQTFIKDIGKQQAPSGKGIGSILRGKLLGSRFLTGVSSAAGYSIEDPRTIGIPESYASQMFREMRESGLHNTEQLIEMEKRAMSGEAIGGLMARHPFIGPYSLQPINMKVLKGHTAPTMVIPSRTTMIRMVGQEVANPIQLSPLIGQAGDLDADIFSAMLVSPDLEKKIRTNFTTADNEFTRSYIEHQIRSQLIKAKSPGTSGEALSSMMKRVAEAKKLGTAQEWVPRLSTSLTTARQAVGSRMQGQQAADAAFLLQWLEQVPISGKHLKAQDVLSEKMSSTFQTIASSIEERNPVRLESAVNAILGESNETTRNLLTQNMKIAEGAESIRGITGIKSFSDTLSGINLKSTSENIMKALGSASDNGDMEISKLISGRQRLGMENLGKYLNILQKPSIPGFAGFSSLSMALKNASAIAGEGLIKHHKKIGLGFLGSIALAASLSQPKDTIGPGIGTLPNTPISKNPGKAINRMDNIHPDNQLVGNPSVPGMMNVPTTRILPGSTSTQTLVKARSMDKNMTNSLIFGVGRISNGNVNVNIRDNRRSMDPNKIMNEML